MITAGVLLHLADDGLLDIDAPVAEAVEWGAGNPDVTVAQLLSNSSGLVGLLIEPGVPAVPVPVPPRRHGRGLRRADLHDA